MVHTSETLRLAFHYLWPDELVALKNLALSLPDNPVVINIGAGAGTSGLAFMESRDDLKLYTVDIQKEDSPFGCLFAEKAVIQAEFPDTDRHVQIHAASVFCGVMWSYGLVDMVFIDGDHSYEGCKGDIVTWLPHIKPGGIIAIHDYGKEMAYTKPHGLDVPHEKPWPGVDKAVKELLWDKLPIITHVDTLIAFKVLHES